MNIAVLSDIHSNLNALNAVMRELPNQVQEIWFLGDLFGYGPHPQHVVDILQKERRLGPWLAGNHDWGVANKFAFPGISKDTKISWELNRNALQSRIIEEVAAKPTQMTPVRNGVRVYLCHGFPSEDEVDQITQYDYKQTPLRKDGYNGNGHRLVEFQRKNFPEVRLFLVGHSHRRTGWKWNGSSWGYLSDQPFGTPLDGDRQVESLEKSISFSLPLFPNEKETFYLLNPSSVGFPNDGCGTGTETRYAKYMLLDISPEEIAVDYRAVEYKFEELKESWTSYPASIRGKLNLE